MSSTRKYELYAKEFRKSSHATFAQMRVEDPIVKQAGLDGETYLMKLVCLNHPVKNGRTPILK